MLDWSKVDLRVDGEGLGSVRGKQVSHMEKGASRGPIQATSLSPWQ